MQPYQLIYCLPFTMNHHISDIWYFPNLSRYLGPLFFQSLRYLRSYQIIISRIWRLTAKTSSATDAHSIIPSVQDSIVFLHQISLNKIIHIVAGASATVLQDVDNEIKYLISQKVFDLTPIDISTILKDLIVPSWFQQRLSKEFSITFNVNINSF